MIDTFKDSPFSLSTGLNHDSLVKKESSLILVKKGSSLILAAGIKTLLFSYNKTEPRRNRLLQHYESFHEICICYSVPQII